MIGGYYRLLFCVGVTHAVVFVGQDRFEGNVIDWDMGECFSDGFEYIRKHRNVQWD